MKTVSNFCHKALGPVRKQRVALRLVQWGLVAGLAVLSGSTAGALEASIMASHLDQTMQHTPDAHLQPLAANVSQDHLLPDFDLKTLSMDVERGSFVDTAPEDETPYFLKPIPKKIHNIWFGNAASIPNSKYALWHKFATEFGYEHRLWSEADLDEIERLMPSDNFALLSAYLHKQMYHAASDLLRTHLLYALGGIYVDIDMGPPHLRDGQMVDLARIMPLTNCLFMTERHGRNVGNSAIFLMNGFMGAAPGHPMMKHLVDSVVANATKFTNERPDEVASDGYHRADYLTGPFFLNKALAGPLSVIPFTTGVAWQMITLTPGTE